MTQLARKAIDFGETQKGLLRRSRSFKVIEDGISRKPVSITSYLTVSELWQLIVQIFDTSRSSATLWGNC